MQVPLDVRLKYISPVWTPEQALAGVGHVEVARNRGSDVC